MGLMPRSDLHDDVLQVYFLHLTLHDTFLPSHDLASEDLLLRLQADLDMYHAIKNTYYLNPQTSVPKSGSLHLAWEYAQNPLHHDLFVQMLHVSPCVFTIVIDHYNLLTQLKMRETHETHLDFTHPPPFT